MQYRQRISSCRVHKFIRCEVRADRRRPVQTLGHANSNPLHKAVFSRHPCTFFEVYLTTYFQYRDYITSDSVFFVNRTDDMRSLLLDTEQHFRTSAPYLLTEHGAYFGNVGNCISLWADVTADDWTFWDAFRMLVICKEIFCSFNICSAVGVLEYVYWDSDNDQFQVIVSLCITYDGRTERIILQAWIRDADIYHRWDRSVIVDSGSFRWLQAFDTVLSLTSRYDFILMAFPSVHVGLQFVSPSIILLLSWGLYFEMSVIYLCRCWQHIPISWRHMSIWTGEVIYKLLTLN
jgi:hypothetical protein